PAAALSPLVTPVTLTAMPLAHSTVSAALLSSAAVGPNSMALLAADKPDLEFDADQSYRRKSSRKRWVLAVAAVGGLGAVGVGVVARGLQSDGRAAVVSLPPVVVQAALVAPPSDGPAPAAKLSNFEAPSAAAPRLSDDVKRALLEADKARAAKNRA